MKKASKPRVVADSMRAEYDFTGGVRNKYAARLTGEGLVVLLDPDVARVFGDAASVNRALRALLDIVPVPKAPRRRSPSGKAAQ